MFSLCIYLFLFFVTSLVPALPPPGISLDGAGEAFLATGTAFAAGVPLGGALG